MYFLSWHPEPREHCGSRESVLLLLSLFQDKRLKRVMKLQN
uniref:Uncharacterized protein n=1 Tax=Anguilla anguilla TaxID=7936 RepID=A0A0E9TUK5_ANGAN